MQYTVVSNKRSALLNLRNLGTGTTSKLSHLVSSLSGKWSGSKDSALRSEPVCWHRTTGLPSCLLFVTLFMFCKTTWCYWINEWFMKVWPSSSQSRKYSICKISELFSPISIASVFNMNCIFSPTWVPDNIEFKEQRALAADGTKIASKIFLLDLIPTELLEIFPFK